MTTVRPMPDSQAPQAWMLEHLSLAQVRAMQEETCTDLDALLLEFGSLEGIGEVYRRRSFFMGRLDGNESSGLLGPLVIEYRKRLNAAESKAKRRITKTLGIKPPYRLPTLNEWNASYGSESPRITLPRLITRPS